MLVASPRFFKTGRYFGAVIGCVLLALLVATRPAVAAPAHAPIPFTVGPGAVGSIGGQMGSIVSIPAGAALTPSPQGILLPVGTVVEINGTRQTLNSPTPFVLTTGGIRPPTLPGTGTSTRGLTIELLLGAMLVVTGGFLFRRRGLGR